LDETGAFKKAVGSSALAPCSKFCARSVKGQSPADRSKTTMVFKR
jgi:hypothetical protein